MIRKCLTHTAIFFICAATAAQQPLNFNFEKLSVEGIKRPWGWSVYSYHPTATATFDSVIKHGGAYSYKISCADTLSSLPFAMGYWVAPQFLYGQQLKISGWYKTDHLSGKARVAAESYGNMGTLSTLDSASKIITGLPANTIWTKFEFNTTVSAAAVSTYLILELTGGGTIWFDDISFSIHGKPISSVPVAPDISSSQLQWLSQYCYPLKTSDPSPGFAAEDFSDLEPFRKIVGDASIIALGESSHGTSEFFKMKHRLLEYAVKEMHVNVFAIEANQLACERINDYVCHGTGVPEKLIKTLFAVWNTEEVLALIKWMRDYNLKHPGSMVEFIGIDMQDPLAAMDSVSAFLGKYDPLLKIQIDSLLANYKSAWKKQYYPVASDSVLAEWKNNAELAWQLINDRKAGWILTSPLNRNEIEWAIQNTKLIYQNATLRSYLNNSLNSVYRDSCMAQNLKWSLDRRPGATRTILWAHDAHISKCGSPDAANNYFTGESMGSFLVQLYREKYRSFALSTYSGTYSGTKSFFDYTVVTSDLLPSPKGSIDEALHRIAIKEKVVAALLDLRNFKKLPAGHWALAPRPVRFIGYASEDYTYAQRVSVPYQFDAVILIDKTNHSILLK